MGAVRRPGNAPGRAGARATATPRAPSRRRRARRSEWGARGGGRRGRRHDDEASAPADATKRNWRKCDEIAHRHRHDRDASSPVFTSRKCSRSRLCPRSPEKRPAGRSRRPRRARRSHPRARLRAPQHTRGPARAQLVRRDVRRGGVHRGVQVVRSAHGGAELRPPLQRHHRPQWLRQVQHPGLHLLRPRHHQPQPGEYPADARARWVSRAVSCRCRGAEARRRRGSARPRLPLGADGAPGPRSARFFVLPPIIPARRSDSGRRPSSPGTLPKPSPPSFRPPRAAR